MADEQPAKGDNPTPEKAEEAKTPVEDPAKGVPEGAENPDAVKRALDAERGAAKEAKKRADAAEAKVAEFEEANKTELEKLTGKVESLTNESKGTKAENLRLRVALDKKLPSELIDRLQGSTQEEIEADADKLLELVKTDTPPPTMDGGTREPAPDPKTPEQAHSDFLMKIFGSPKNT